MTHELRGHCLLSDHASRYPGAEEPKKPASMQTLMAIQGVGGEQGKRTSKDKKRAYEG